MKRGIFAGGVTILLIGLVLLYIGIGMPGYYNQQDYGAIGFFMVIGIIIALCGLVITMVGAFGREVVKIS